MKQFLKFKQTNGMYGLILNCDCKVCDDDCETNMLIERFIDSNWLWESRKNSPEFSKYFLKILFSRYVKDKIFSNFNVENFKEIYDVREILSHFIRKARRKIIFENLDIVFKRKNGFCGVVYENIYTMIAGDFLLL
jgi:hypothetical protein